VPVLGDARIPIMGKSSHLIVRKKKEGKEGPGIPQFSSRTPKDLRITH
jgi:hypothetical protein